MAQTDGYEMREQSDWQRYQINRFRTSTCALCFIPKHFLAMNKMFPPFMLSGCHFSDGIEFNLFDLVH